MPSGGRASEAVAIFDAKTASILEFEDFIESLAFLSASERARLTIAGGEIFDNIVRYSTPIAEGKMKVRASRRSGALLLAFFFRSESFAEFAHRGGLAAAPERPYFDPESGRWRGIGLIMCRNLTSRIMFRAGNVVDCILLQF